jgi:hypothetical protein
MSETDFIKSAPGGEAAARNLPQRWLRRLRQLRLPRTGQNLFSFFLSWTARRGALRGGIGLIAGPYPSVR